MRVLVELYIYIYHDTFTVKIENKEIFDNLTFVAQDRDAWKRIVDALVETRITDCSKKRYVQRQKRKDNFNSIESPITSTI